MAERPASLPQARYSAFVSYSHCDEKHAKWLHRRLETYRLPRRLMLEGQERVRPVFRDSAELAAASDLDTAISSALEISEYLIVICTPDAVLSEWVAHEIDLFRGSHNTQKILAALFGGDERTAFPNQLIYFGANGQRVIPLAADFRRHGYARRLALLQLLAPLLHVDLDALIQRDVQRRHQRVVMAAFAALLLATVLLGLLLQAISERREAERQRNAAESLVEFMVGDLRMRLEPIGKLAILDAIGGRALQYYQAERANRSLAPSSLASRARVLRMVGDIQSQQGNLTAALANSREAANSTERLLKISPNDPQRVFDHAQSIYYIGSISLQQKRFADAQSAFKKYRDLAERLVKLDPRNPKWQPEPGYAASNLGTILLQRGYNQSAEQPFRRALAVSEVSLRSFPNDNGLKYDLAQSYAWLADTLERLGRFNDALYNRRAELRIYQSMLDLEMDDRKAFSRRVNAESAEARIIFKLGDQETAHRIATVVGKDAIFLFNRDRKNIPWSYICVSALIDTAEIELYRGRLKSAEHYSKLANYIANLSFRAGDVGGRTYLASVLILKSRVKLAQENNNAATVYAQRALNILGKNADLNDRGVAVRFLRANAVLLASENGGVLLEHKRTLAIEAVTRRFIEYDSDIKNIKMEIDQIRGSQT